MKIEAEIADIDRDEVIEAMARQLLTRYSMEYESDTGVPYEQPHKTPLNRAMRALLERKIDLLAQTLVRERFDRVVTERIAAAVDVVLDNGWTATDNYGNAKGPRVDLRGHISELLHDKKSEGYNKPSYTLAERLVTDKVSEVFSKELNKEIEAARAALRVQLDGMITTKFAETLKAALGLR